MVELALKNDRVGDTLAADETNDYRLDPKYLRDTLEGLAETVTTIATKFAESEKRDLENGLKLDQTVAAVQHFKSLDERLTKLENAQLDKAQNLDKRARAVKQIREWFTIGIAAAALWVSIARSGTAHG